MQTIYNIMEAIIPFSFIKFDFMKNALLATILLTPLFGMLGTMAVNNKMASSFQTHSVIVLLQA